MNHFARPTTATILVVESEAIVCSEFADWLRRGGLIVLTANDADEAIAALDSHPEIEVLLTDIAMPGSMDGLRLAHHVRGRWPPVKILVMSGRLQTELSELPSGSVFMPKPVERQKLWWLLSDLVDAAPPHSLGPHAGLAA